MASGSVIINLASSGLPTETTDRAFAFCLGTQILQNPDHDPRIGTFSFLINPDMLDVSVSGNTVGTTAMGLATSTNVSSIAQWSSTNEISDNGDNYGVYCVSFAEDENNGGLINYSVAGASLGTIAKNRTADNVNIFDNSFTCSGHGYNAGDAVVIASGSLPSPLATGITYYVIPVDGNNISLAETRLDAITDNEINIFDVAGPIYLESADLFEFKRDGTDPSNGDVTLSVNGVEVYVFPEKQTATLRPFFWSRERSNSATIPIFKAIKVSGAS